MAITPSQARTFYDRFGARQDAQAFYEDAALDELVAHGAFERATSVFEFGCGTGRFASRLLDGHLPPTASYYGIDISATMIRIASGRVARYGDRARVSLAEGAMALPLADSSVDRVVSTYVLDLLPERDVSTLIAEVARVLRPGGNLCLAGLTEGNTVASKLVSGLWSAVFHLNPRWVGGCRPVRIEPVLREQAWAVECRDVVTPFGVPSEVIVARPPDMTNNAVSPAPPDDRDA